MRQLVQQLCYTRCQVSFCLWQIRLVLRHCKVRKCYDQDWRCETVLMLQSRELFLSDRENLVENEKFLIGVVVGFINFLFRCICIKWKLRNNGHQRRWIGVKLLPDAPSVDKHRWKTSIFFRIALVPSLQK